MNLTDEQIEEMCERIVDNMGIDELMAYVYDDLLSLNLKDREVAEENYRTVYGLEDEE